MDGKALMMTLYSIIFVLEYIYPLNGKTVFIRCIIHGRWVVGPGLHVFSSALCVWKSPTAVPMHGLNCLVYEAISGGGIWGGGCAIAYGGKIEIIERHMLCDNIFYCLLAQPGAGDRIAPLRFVVIGRGFPSIVISITKFITTDLLTFKYF